MKTQLLQACHSSLPPSLMVVVVRTSPATHAFLGKLFNLDQRTRLSPTLLPTLTAPVAPSLVLLIFNLHQRKLSLFPYFQLKLVAMTLSFTPFNAHSSTCLSFLLTFPSVSPRPYLSLTSLHTPLPLSLPISSSSLPASPHGSVCVVGMSKDT